MRKTPHQAEQGFLTFAQNTADVDYLQLAHTQAINIKKTQPNALCAVIVDDQTSKELTTVSQKPFDYVIILEHDYAQETNWKLSNEWQAFWLTPFKETIKVESDILFTRDISHWWTAFRSKDLVLSVGCKDYLGKQSTSRKYRKVFDLNYLPDVYNGLMYFRFSSDASRFFSIARDIFQNWDAVRDQVLIDCRDPEPTTDLVYAIATRVLGEEKCTVPTMDFINFTHMKPGIQGWNDSQSWLEHAVVEIDDNMIRINNVNQYHPFHYQDKNFFNGRN